jgi:hypothetical protein
VGVDVPNFGTAFDNRQSKLDRVDFDILIAPYVGTGVVTGCLVTQRAAGANMSVDVAAGTVQVGATRVAVSQGNVVVSAADGANPRFDLVVVNNAGAKSVVSGTAGSEPVFPGIPANSVVLASVFVGAGVTSILDAHIKDRRITYGLTAAHIPATPSGQLIGDTVEEQLVELDSRLRTVSFIDELQSGSRIYDDFYGSNVVGTSGSPGIGLLGWNAAGSGTGAAITSVADSATLGAVELTTGSTATGWFHLNLKTTAFDGSPVFTIEWRAKLGGPVSAPGELWLASLGLTDIAAAGLSGYGTDGFMFNLPNADATWWIVTLDGGVVSEFDSGIVADYTNYHRYRIVCTGSAVHFYIDGVQAANSPIPTNLPDPTDTYGPQAWIEKETGTSPRTMRCDWFAGWIEKAR